MSNRLEVATEVDVKRYCLYGDSGYKLRWFMDVPHQGAQQTVGKKYFNKEM